MASEPTEAKEALTPLSASCRPSTGLNPTAVSIWERGLLCQLLSVRGRRPWVVGLTLPAIFWATSGPLVVVTLTEKRTQMEGLVFDRQFSRVRFSYVQGRYRCLKGRWVERYGQVMKSPAAVAAGQREQALGHLQLALEIDSRTARSELAGLQPLAARLSKSCLRCML